MSLKAFHVFFIAVSILLAVGFAVWEAMAFIEDGAAGQLIAALLALGVAAALIVYGIHFVRKLKHIGYL